MASIAGAVAAGCVDGTKGLLTDGPPVDTAEVSRQIADVLKNPAYRLSEPTFLERLLGPVYDWMERAIAFAFDLILNAIDWLLGFFQMLGIRRAAPIVVLIAAALGAVYLVRRRARDIERRSTIERILELGVDPAELERMADEADTRGDHAESIRLRFVAGLLRLDASGAIDFYPGLANSVISETLSDRRFDRLAAQFDRVVYGRKPTGPDDAASARAEWQELLGVRA